MTVTYCNEVTPLDKLPKIPTLWEEDRKGGGGGEVGGKGGRRGAGGEKEAKKEDEKGGGGSQGGNEGRATKGKASREDSIADLVSIVSKVVCTVLREL